VSEDDAPWLASALDAVDWPLILVVTADDPRRLGSAITGRLDRTIRLDAPST
jgi:hypothetical protein